MNNVYYLCRKQEDGKYTIYDVDFFAWGKNNPIAPMREEKALAKTGHYTEEWCRAALAAYEKLRAENGYAGPYHLDHNEDAQETSRKLVAFFTDLSAGDGRGDVVQQQVYSNGKWENILRMRRGKADRCYCNLRGIDEKDLEVLKKWPYRSVEILDPAVPMFSSLAALQSIPPFFQFRPLIWCIDESETAPAFAFQQQPLEPALFRANAGAKAHRRFFYVQKEQSMNAEEMKKDVDALRAQFEAFATKYAGGAATPNPEDEGKTKMGSGAPEAQPPVDPNKQAAAPMAPVQQPQQLEAVANTEGPDALQEENPVAALSAGKMKAGGADAAAFAAYQKATDEKIAKLTAALAETRAAAAVKAKEEKVSNFRAEVSSFFNAAARDGYDIGKVEDMVDFVAGEHPFTPEQWEKFKAKFKVNGMGFATQGPVGPGEATKTLAPGGGSPRSASVEKFKALCTEDGDEGVVAQAVETYNATPRFKAMGIKQEAFVKSEVFSARNKRKAELLKS